METVLHTVKHDVHGSVFTKLMASRHVIDLKQELTATRVTYHFNIQHLPVCRYGNLLYCFRESGIINMKIINGSAVFNTKL